MKVHLVNKTKSAHEAVEQSLKKSNFSISVSTGFENAIDEIQKIYPRIVLINWAKDDSSVADLCNKIRKLKSVKYIYIIIIAARDKQKSLYKIIQAGADDFVFKPFGKDELVIRIDLATKGIKLEDTVEKSKKKLMKLAKEDPLTNLYNRRALYDEALKEMGRASREAKFLASIMLEILNFKDIIEEHGALVSNAVLVELSRMLKRFCRPYDKMGKYSITDFLVLLPDSGQQNAQKVANRILSSIKNKPLKIRGNKVNVEISIGISELDSAHVARNDHADSKLMNDVLLDSLIRRSELAMQKATDKGSNNLEIFKI